MIPGASGCSRSDNLCVRFVYSLNNACAQVLRKARVVHLRRSNPWHPDALSHPLDNLVRDG